MDILQTFMDTMNWIMADAPSLYALIIIILFVGPFIHYVRKELKKDEATKKIYWLKTLGFIRDMKVTNYTDDNNNTQVNLVLDAIDANGYLVSTKVKAMIASNTIATRKHRGYISIRMNPLDPTNSLYIAENDRGVINSALDRLVHRYCGDVIDLEARKNLRKHCKIYKATITHVKTKDYDDQSMTVQLSLTYTTDGHNHPTTVTMVYPSYMHDRINVGNTVRLSIDTNDLTNALVDLEPQLYDPQQD